MSKVSKNIKKFRNDKGMTQDALAEKICVTRQTISSWENGRTLPDIEMLELLSEAFGVGIEEVIYGEKKKIGLEPPKSDKRKIMNIVFATLGSLLTATGLIILFVSFVDEIPDVLFLLLSYVPLLLGGGIAVYAYLKKRNSIGWSEGASVAWIAGFVATFMLTVMIHNIIIDEMILLTALLAVLLIIALIMKSLFPMIGYYAITAFMTSTGIQSDDYYIYAIIGIVFFLLGFIYIAKAPKKDYKRVCSVWLSIICAGVFIAVASEETSSSYAPIFCTLFAICAALYSADTTEKAEYPFRFIAVPAVSVMMTMLSFAHETFLDGFYIEKTPCLEFPGIAPFVSAVIIPLGIYIGRKSFSQNKEKIAFVALTASSSVLCALKAIFQQYLLSNGASLAITIIATAIALATSVVIIISGIRKTKMLTVNLGLIMLCVTIYLTLLAGSIDIVTGGIACVVMGGALLFINFRLSKSFKAKEAEQNA